MGDGLAPGVAHPLDGQHRTTAQDGISCFPPAAANGQSIKVNGGVEDEGAEVDEPELERASSSARSEEDEPSHHLHPNTHDTLLLASTISLLIFATIWGVLARLGLEWIGGFAEEQVFSLIWAQIVGCLLMGLVVERKNGLEKL